MVSANLRAQSSRLQNINSNVGQRISAIEWQKLDDERLKLNMSTRNASDRIEDMYDQILQVSARETNRETEHQETNVEADEEDEKIELAPYRVGPAGRTFFNYLKTVLMPDLLQRLAIVEREKHMRIERRKSDTANLEQLVKAQVKNAD